MVNATIFYSIKLNRSIRLVYGILRHMKGIRQASCHRDTNDTQKYKLMSCAVTIWLASVEESSISRWTLISSENASVTRRISNNLDNM